MNAENNEREEKFFQITGEEIEILRLMIKSRLF
jgi:hypothetical protein